ncbi:nucleoside deaminase [Herbaspirillum rhizosphaerae]|uniref:nucleoside deaminase n=1 Tax=Herbaspirillum rhizosphaerae TaxID=346179 RepID=UPI00067D3077|nr:nucleoside deaminase [Herbaspirillum rhizosphaerae]
MTFNDSDIKAMRLAIQASSEALADGDMPFGATLVSPQGEILLVAANNQNSAADCTGHAEMVLVRTAQKQLGLRALRGATVYASGEPCAMCSGAMFWAEIKRVVYAASTAQIGAALGGPQLPLRSAETLANASPAMIVDGPLMAEEACAVLARFVPD